MSGAIGENHEKKNAPADQVVIAPRYMHMHSIITYL